MKRFFAELNEFSPVRTVLGVPVVIVRIGRRVRFGVWASGG